MTAILVLNISVSTLLIVSYLWMVIVAIRYIIAGGNGSSPFLALVGSAMILVQSIDVVHAIYELVGGSLHHEVWWVAVGFAKFAVMVCNFTYYAAVLVDARRSIKKNSVVRNLIFGRLIDDN